MPRVRIAPALPDRKSLDVEIARLRDLDVGELRNHWHNVFGRRPHPYLPRHHWSQFGSVDTVRPEIGDPIAMIATPRAAARTEPISTPIFAIDAELSAPGNA